MSLTVLVPARMASSRLPDKPLADLGGVPMVVRVAQRVHGAARVARVVVAADDARILEACRHHGVECVLTRTDHASGTDRLAEAATLLGLPDEAVVVNVQGDEPLIAPALVSAVGDLLLKTPSAQIATAAHTINTIAEFHNPNVVKVVLDAQCMALLFSRAPIPWPRDTADALPQPAALRHIGLYAYRVGYLRRYPLLPPAPLERTESLEQLRALWHGDRIAVYLSAHAPAPGVDTPEDLQRVRALLAR
ncbi:MAG: 3-deoxy-manno-octulosonate cytidylyltransferase [Rhodoferax sp.]